MSLGTILAGQFKPGSGYSFLRIISTNWAEANVSKNHGCASVCFAPVYEGSVSTLSCPVGRKGVLDIAGYSDTRNFADNIMVSVSRQPMSS